MNVTLSETALGLLRALADEDAQEQFNSDGQAFSELQDAGFATYNTYSFGYLAFITDAGRDYLAQIDGAKADEPTAQDGVSTYKVGDKVGLINYPNNVYTITKSGLPNYCVEVLDHSTQVTHTAFVYNLTTAPEPQPTVAELQARIAELEALVRRTRNHLEAGFTELALDNLRKATS